MSKQSKRAQFYAREKACRKLVQQLRLRYAPYAIPGDKSKVGRYLLAVDELIRHLKPGLITCLEVHNETDDGRGRVTLNDQLFERGPDGKWTLLNSVVSVGSK